MNFLGIGPLELVLILILALIFLGPEDLPVAMRKLGKLVRQIQDVMAEVNTGLQEELGPEIKELNRVTREAQKIAQNMQNPAGAIFSSASLPPSPEAREKGKPSERPTPSRRPLSPSPPATEDAPGKEGS
ncbi:MAG: twin-arginine translocase subunit TatB [Chloroflexi bacterium]|nr:twin-arginine translocase subunit TatB [Chloroflexota bacterium]